MRYISLPLLLLLLSGIMLSLSSCDSEDTNCEGRLRVLSDIQDVILIAGGEPEVVPLFGVFYQTRQTSISVNKIETDFDIIDVEVQSSPTSTIPNLLVTPRSVGTTTVLVEMMDDCSGRLRETDFIVVVTEGSDEMSASY